MSNRSFVVACLFSFAPGFNLCETSALTPALSPHPPSLRFGAKQERENHSPPFEMS